MEPRVETREVIEWGMTAANLLTTRRRDHWKFEVVAQVFTETELISPATRRAYLGQLIRGAKLLGLEFALDIQMEHLMLLRKAVMDSPASPSSKSQMMAAWRGFMKWRCIRPIHGIPREDIDDLLQPPRAKVIRPYDVLSRAETTKLLEQAGTLRDCAILFVMLGAGLRAAEVVGLDCSDVRLDAEGEYFLLVHGKARRDRQVPVHQEVVDAILAYLSESHRKLGDGGPLFRAHDRARHRRDRRRLTTRALGFLIDSLTRACGLHGKKLSPHALRHSYAIAALRQGGNVVAVSKLLGHSQVSTTQKYLDHLELGELRKAVPKVTG